MDHGCGCVGFLSLFQVAPPIDKVTIQTVQIPKAQDHLLQVWTTQKFTPLDPVSKRITAAASKDGKNYIAAKVRQTPLLSSVSLLRKKTTRNVLAL